MAIGFIGAGAAATSNTSGATITPAYPGGYTAVADDVAIVVCGGKHNNGSSLVPTAPTGYTQAATYFHELGAVDQQLTVWYKKLTTSEAAPSTTVPAAYSGTTAGIILYTAIYRGVNTTTQLDATSVTSFGAAAATFTPTGITTATAGCVIVSCALTADDNTLNFTLPGNELGFSLRRSGNYTGGGDNCLAFADAQVGAAGAWGCPTYRETTVGNDAWCGVTLALRPASYTGQADLAGPIFNNAVQRSAVR